MRLTSVLSIYLCFCCCFLLLNCKNEQAEKSPKGLNELFKQSMTDYRNDPVKSIPTFQELEAVQLDANLNDRAAITQLNIANIYDEHASDYKSSLSYANKALKIWTDLDDKKQMANLYKYTGYLKGKLKNFSEGHQDIDKAIGKYESLGFDQGIAVSRFNKARVYFEAGDYPSSLEQFLSAHNYWKSKNNQNRLFSLNIFGIKLAKALGMTSMMKELIEENKSIVATAKISPNEIKRFNEVIH